MLSFSPTMNLEAGSPSLHLFSRPLYFNRTAHNHHSRHYLYLHLHMTMSLSAVSDIIVLHPSIEEVVSRVPLQVPPRPDRPHHLHEHRPPPHRYPPPPPPPPPPLPGPLQSQPDLLSDRLHLSSQKSSILRILLFLLLLLLAKIINHQQSPKHRHCHHHHRQISEYLPLLITTALHPPRPSSIFSVPCRRRMMSVIIPLHSPIRAHLYRPHFVSRLPHHHSLNPRPTVTIRRF